MGDTFLLVDRYIREELRLNFSHILMDSYRYGEVRCIHITCRAGLHLSELG
jgi:hypothetical protein